MSTSPADSTDLPGSAIMLRETQAAMLEFFAVLIRMPHVENGMIQNPGPDGWLNVNVDALTSHGKLAAAIDVLRHLPYIVSTSRNGATICPDYSSYSRGIAYGDGEVCADWREEIFTTPPHVVLLADANTDEGHCLLLDTLTWSITEYDLRGESPFLLGDEMNMLIQGEYDAMPQCDQWMAFQTLPASEWFRRERIRLENLVYMPVPPLPSEPEGPHYWFRATDTEAEEDLLAQMDEDYLTAHSDGAMDVDSDEDEDEMNDDGSESERDTNTDIPVDEVTDLHAETLEIYGNDAHVLMTTTGVDGRWKPVTPPSAEHIHVITHEPSPSPEVESELAFDLTAHNMPSSSERSLNQIYDIYTHNGWPSNAFDREACKRDLYEWSAAQIKVRQTGPIAMSEAAQAIAQERDARKWELASWVKVEHADLADT